MRSVPLMLAALLAAPASVPASQRPPCGYLVRGVSAAIWFDDLGAALTGAGFTLGARTPGRALSEPAELVATLTETGHRNGHPSEGRYRVTLRHRCWATGTDGALDCCPEVAVADPPTPPDAARRNQTLAAFERAVASALQRVEVTYTRTHDGTRPVYAPRAVGRVSPPREG